MGMDRWEARDAILRTPPWRTSHTLICGDMAGRSWYPTPPSAGCPGGIEVDEYFNGNASYEAIALFIRDGRVVKMRRWRHVDGPL